MPTSARKAQANGWICAMPVERSGITPSSSSTATTSPRTSRTFDPTFSKILVRYNPEGNARDNEQSLAELLRLSNWLRDADRKLLCELIVPPEPAQLAAVEGDDRRYRRRRPPRA